MHLLKVNLICSVLVVHFKNQLFLCFKSRTKTIEKGELTIVLFDKSKQNIEERTVLEEKLFCEKARKNSGKKLKKYDIIKVNKIKEGTADNSEFFLSLLQRRHLRHLDIEVKNKLSSIEERLNYISEIMSGLNLNIEEISAKNN